MQERSSRGYGPTSRLITAMNASRSLKTTPHGAAALSHAEKSFSSSYPNGYHSKYDGRQFESHMFATNISYGDDYEPSKPIKSGTTNGDILKANVSDSDYLIYDATGVHGPSGFIPSTRKRVFIPENQKDDAY
ncbi:hypothetical protein DPMN_191907 [Dreissena polymorpha]|uniref:Uncharacterized protein n=1 Tax=Dreissena polymorpha TaxID=45954 RepID=A0A9D4BCI7_DREPO|nr:hypothetical protein DPMN_191907 [Dreissena polymorpha]